MGSVFRSRERKPTVFTPFVDEYFLNSKGVLEKKPTPRNQQEFINSQVYTKLDDIYDRFSDIGALTNVSYVDDVVRDVMRYETDVDVLLEADRVIDEYRSQFGLSADMSRSDIYGLIMSRARTARDNMYKETTVINNESKKGFNDEKKENTPIEEGK